MSPQQKAEEIKNNIRNVDCLKDFEGMDDELLQQTSLICIDEIIKAGNDVISDLMDGYKDQEFNDYWQEVKNEIEKL